MPADSAAMLHGGGAASSMGSSNTCFNIHLGKEVKALACAAWGVGYETSAWTWLLKHMADRVFQKYLQLYLPSHMVFSQSDVDKPPTEMWSLCSLPLNFGGL